MAVTVNPRPASSISSELLARWSKVPAAIVADISNGACLIDPDIRPLLPPGKQPRLIGLAVTAVCEPPDLGAILHALDGLLPGDVLVIDAKGHRGNAVIGGILSGHLRRKGASGFVCDGAIRDVAEIAQWPEVSAYARHITPRGPVGMSVGQVNAPAMIGGRLVNPGDLIIGDDDGLVAVSAQDIVTMIDKAEARLALEERWQAGLAAGETITKTFGV